MFLVILPSCYYPERQHIMSHFFPPSNNQRSHQPTSIPVGVFPTLLYVLGVCKVGVIPIASSINPIPSPLYIVSSCPPILPVSYPVSIPSAAPNVLLPSLPFVSVISSLVTAFYISSEIHVLVSWPAVLNKADVILSRLPEEVHMQAGIVAEVVPFWVKIDAYFTAVYSLQERDSVSIILEDKPSGYIRHPQMWVYVRVSVLLPLYLLSQARLRPSHLLPNCLSSLLFLSHCSSMLESPLKRGGWWSIQPFPPFYEALRTLIVLLSPRLPVTWYFTNAGTTGLTCGFCTLIIYQIDSFLQRSFCIDTQSDQCDEAILPSLCRGFLPLRGSP